MSQKYYVVKAVDSGKSMLVRAASRGRARVTATRLAFTVDLATQEQLVELVKQGVPVWTDETRRDGEAAPALAD